MSPEVQPANTLNIVNCLFPQEAQRNYRKWHMLGDRRFP